MRYGVYVQLHNVHNVYMFTMHTMLSLSAKYPSSTSRTFATFVYNRHNDCAIYCIFVLRYISCTSLHNQINLNTY